MLQRPPDFWYSVFLCFALLSACEPIADSDDAGRVPLPSLDAAAKEGGTSVEPAVIPMRDVGGALGIDASVNRGLSDGGDATTAVDGAAILDGARADAAASQDAALGGDAAAISACSGKPGAKRGKSSQTLMAGGARRSFIHYAPKDLDPNVPVPLLIVPHGTNMSG
jgi:hypothetical protein